MPFCAEGDPRHAQRREDTLIIYLQQKQLYFEVRCSSTFSLIQSFWKFLCFGKSRNENVNRYIYFCVILFEDDLQSA